MIFFSFRSGPYFLIESWINVPDLAKFVSWHLMAAHSHFHGHKFLTAKIFLYGWFSENRPSPRPPGNPAGNILFAVPYADIYLKPPYWIFFNAVRYLTLNFHLLDHTLYVWSIFSHVVQAHWQTVFLQSLTHYHLSVPSIFNFKLTLSCNFFFKKCMVCFPSIGLQLVSSFKCLHLCNYVAQS